MNQENVNPETDSAAIIAQDKTLKAVKYALVIMTALIIAGVAVLIGVAVKRFILQPEPVIAQQEAIRLLLPAGSIGKIGTLSLGPNHQLAMSVETAEGPIVYVIDLKTSKILTTIELVRTGSPVASFEAN